MTIWNEILLPLTPTESWAFPRSAVVLGARRISQCHIQVQNMLRDLLQIPNTLYFKCQACKHLTVLAGHLKAM